jgi:alpha/beta superfamily hydrolase
MGGTRKLWIEGPAGRIEAALRVAQTPRATAVVAHPHPLHGGTLHNPVVFHAERSLNRAGLTTLRFNFRGVGSSDGEHDKGEGEVSDVAAAVNWMRGLADELPLLLVGYSFGAWCAIRHAATNENVRGLIAIGLPVSQFPLSGLERLPCPLAVVQGSHDEFGTAERVQAFLEDYKPDADVRIVEGTTHLFPGRVPDAADAVVAAAEHWLASADQDQVFLDRP